jgi:O-antigen ligase
MQYVMRTQSMYSGGYGYSRWETWCNYIVAIFSSPKSFFIGQGTIIPASFSLEVLESAHNSYIHIFYTDGLIGLILLTIIVLKSLSFIKKTIPRKHNLYILGIVTGMLSFLISQIFDNKLALWWIHQCYFFMFLGFAWRTLEWDEHKKYCRENE